jgi:2-iminobutanoate/2-iminopropanoate deaminase
MSDTPETKTFGPYTPVRQAGDLYFVSGQVGVDPTTGEAALDVAAQTRQVLDNLAHVLQTAGLGMDDVVKTTIYVTDMADFAAINAVYMTYFAEPRPARATVGVAALPNVAKNTPLKVEIEAIARQGVAHDNS